MFPLENIGDLLATALVLTDAQRPDQSLDCRRDLTRSSGPFLGLCILREKPGQPVSCDPLEPESDGLPMSAHVRGNRRMTETLGGKLIGQRDLGKCRYVHRLLWTVGYLRQHCALGAGIILQFSLCRT
jgi:hypothetical protein